MKLRIRKVSNIQISVKLRLIRFYRIFLLYILYLCANITHKYIICNLHLTIGMSENLLKSNLAERVGSEWLPWRKID